MGGTRRSAVGQYSTVPYISQWWPTGGRKPRYDKKHDKFDWERITFLPIEYSEHNFVFFLPSPPVPTFSAYFPFLSFPSFLGVTSFLSIFLLGKVLNDLSNLSGRLTVPIFLTFYIRLGPAPP